jgi:tetratricopeptide (TPR) repeat protein
MPQSRGRKIGDVWEISNRIRVDNSLDSRASTTEHSAMSFIHQCLLRMGLAAGLSMPLMIVRSLTADTPAPAEGVAADRTGEKSDASPGPLAGQDVSALVAALSDPEPQKRESARAELERRGESVRGELEAAEKSAPPAQKLAIRGVLGELGWFDPDEPREIREIVDAYRRQTDGELRLTLGASLLENAAGIPTAVRLLCLEKDEQVAFQLAELIDASLEPAKQAAVRHAPTAQTSVGSFLMAQVHALEVDRFNEHLRTLVGRSTARGNVAALNAIALLDAALPTEKLSERLELSRARVRLVDEEDMDLAIAQLLALHATGGPGEGIDADLQMARDFDQSRLVRLALAWVRPVLNPAQQNGIPAETIEQLLLEPLNPEEGLDDAADRLFSAGLFELAELEYTRILSLPDLEPQTREIVFLLLHRTARGAGDVAAQKKYLTEALAVPGGNALRRDYLSASLLAINATEALEAGDGVGFEKLLPELRRAADDGAQEVLRVAPALDANRRRETSDDLIRRVVAKEKQRLAADDERDMDLAQLNNSIAWTLGRSGRDLAEARQFSLRANELQPLESSYMDTLAEIEHRLGNREEAVRLESQAVLRTMVQVPFMIEQLDRFRAGVKPGEEQIALQPD